jgi:hypothetical protein
VERVFEGHEIEQAVLGLLHEIDPVARAEEFSRSSVGLSPGRAMPAGAVEGDG